MQFTYPSHNNITMWYMDTTSQAKNNTCIHMHDDAHACDATHAHVTSHNNIHIYFMCDTPHMSSYRLRKLPPAVPRSATTNAAGQLGLIRVTEQLKLRWLPPDCLVEHERRAVTTWVRTCWFFVCWFCLFACWFSRYNCVLGFDCPTVLFCFDSLCSALLSLAYPLARGLPCLPWCGYYPPLPR